MSIEYVILILKIVKFHIVRDLKWQLVQIGGEYDARERMRSMAGYYLKAYNFDYGEYIFWSLPLIDLNLLITKQCMSMFDATALFCVTFVV